MAFVKITRMIVALLKRENNPKNGTLYEIKSDLYNVKCSTIK